MQKARIAILSTPTHHHPYSIGLSSATFRQVNSTSSMALPTILSILMESHKDSRTTSLTRTLTTKTTNLAIRINRIILQCSHFLPGRPSVHFFLWKILLMLVLDLLGSGILLLLSLFGTSFETEYQLNCGILGNAVIYQSVVISMADSGKKGKFRG